MNRLPAASRPRSCLYQQISGNFVLSHAPATGPILLELIMSSQVLEDRQIEILGRFLWMLGGDFVANFSGSEWPCGLG